MYIYVHIHIYKFFPDEICIYISPHLNIPQRIHYRCTLTHIVCTYMAVYIYMCVCVCVKYAQYIYGLSITSNSDSQSSSLKNSLDVGEWTNGKTWSLVQTVQAYLESLTKAFEDPRFIGLLHKTYGNIICKHKSTVQKECSVFSEQRLTCSHCFCWKLWDLHAIAGSPSIPSPNGTDTTWSWPVTHLTKDREKKES